MDKLIKPYEISIWEDTLDTSNGGATYKESKIAVIGSNTMQGYNKVYEPVFTKKTNGEKTLTFSLKYQYFDPYIGATVINPFASYLINERKIKLHYDNKWYEFLIKEHTESSDGLVWTYTAVDALVNELSKNGYNKEFDVELGNNQGTAIELGKAVVEGTDWEIDEENSSVGPQEISEAIYNATLSPSSGVKIVNAETGETTTFSGNPSIFVFYNYVANKDGKFVQFILQESNPHNYQLDDNNTIKATNYRIETELIYDDNGLFKKDNGNGTYTNIISIIKSGDRLDLNTEYHAYRKVYGHLSTYDPVMGRTVKRYKLDGLESEIYNYTDYIYSTSDLVVNYISNGDKFNTYDNGTLQGWTEKAQVAGNTYPEIRLVTYPAIDARSAIQALSSYTQIEGYMEVKFPGVFSNYQNGIFNSGIEDSGSILNSISAGDEFIFRWRGATSGSQGGTLAAMGKNVLRVVVAKYNTSDTQVNNRYYNIVDPKNIILDFNTTAQVLNNTITGGTFSSDSKTYSIDGVPQEPSTKYIYNDNKVWNSSLLKYEAKTTSNFFDYYYMTAVAQHGVTPEELSDSSTKIGIFIYVKSGVNNYYYFQDIQLTRLYKDGNDNILTIGNIPSAAISPIEYYYVQPKNGAAAENVETYTTISALADSLGTTESNIKPIYNTNATKYLSISESHSNCYNLLQTIAETFECWVDLVVDHDSNGAITYSYKKTIDTFVNSAKVYYTYNSSTHKYTQVSQPVKSALSTYYELKPNKKVVLRDYVGKDNFAGFKYGINLNTIERIVNSDEIVTKLYVTPAQSDYTDEGNVAISYASMNPSGEEYILNFDYYLKQGLITNVTEARNDINNYYATVQAINKQLRAEENQRRNLEASLTALNSQRNIYSNLIDEAKKNVNDGKDDFTSLTGKTYDEYRGKKTSDQIVDLYYFPTNDTTVYKYKDYFEQISGTGGNTYKKVTKFEDQANPSALHYYEYIPDLESNNTLLNLIAKIYTSSYAINNYTGILTNTEKEYKKVRADLRGSEEFTITIGLIDNSSGMDKLKVTVSDYITGFKFTVANVSYETGVNTKVFEINTNSPSITINSIPSGYTLVNEKGQTVGNTITPSASRIITLTLKPNIKFDGVEDRIEKIQKTKNEIVEWFHNKYRRFIQEGTWGSTDYIDSNLYYLDAISVSNTSAQPQVSYTINVVEVSELEGLQWYNFDAGDKTYIEDTEFFGWSEVGGILTPAREEVIVSEVEWHLEEPENNVITVQNYKTRFEDLFQRISATVQTVQYNEATYAKTSSLMDAYGMLSQTVLLDSLNNISGKPYTLTSDGSIRIDGDRITIRDLKNKANIMTLESTGLRISSDGGKTWATAIDAYGINLDAVFTGKINTNKIIIGSDSNPSFRWDSAGISAYKRDSESAVYDLNTYVRFDQYGLYGIANDNSFVAASLDEVKDKASFAVTWDGFFIRNAYTSGRVEISSTDDFRVVQTYDNRDHERIKIGALEFNSDGQPIKYGIRINRAVYNSETQKWEDKPAFVTGDDGNIEITGIINALGGNFTGLVKVGDENQEHIIIDGEQASIKTSNYSDGASYGWMINKYGDAVFNNITARGAIKTAVFEYAEIQAVGGIFIFRPSSTIRTAIVKDNDLLVTVEKPEVFKEGDYCKVSNYIQHGQNANPDINNILLNNGLTHVYKISIKEVRGEGDSVFVLGESILGENTLGDNDKITKVITLIGGAEMVVGENKVTTLAELVGGALVDMGREDGSSNYGIGVNSSDNTVNLPRRAITLFETEVHPEVETGVKVTYDYKGILGTLPDLSSEYASQNTYKYLKNTQGIYTNNMYIGDANQFVSFYTDTDDLDSNNKPKRKLKIVADEVVYRRDDGSYGDVKNIEIEQGAQGPPGASALQISVLSTFGTSIRDSTGGGVGAMYAKITKDGVEIDPIGSNLQAVTSTSQIQNPVDGQYCIVVNSTNKTALPYRYNGSSWAVVSASTDVTYAWTFRNKDNISITIPGVVVNNKCLYVSADMIDKKLTAEVQIIVE